MSTRAIETALAGLEALGGDTAAARSELTALRLACLEWERSNIPEGLSDASSDTLAEIAYEAEVDNDD